MTDILDPKASFALSSRGLGGLVIFTGLVYLTIVALNIWILTYMFKLEKNNCKCALGWKHKFVQSMIMILLIYQFISFFMDKESRVTKGIKMIMGVLAIVYIIITFMYVKELEDTDCKCSEDPARTTLKVLNYINIALISIIIIITIIGFIMFRNMMNSINTKKEKKYKMYSFGRYY